MEKINIIFVETPLSNKEILGRRAKDFILREFATFNANQSRIIRLENLSKVEMRDDVINVILPLDMPLVEIDDVMRLIKRMKAHKFGYMALDSEIGRISFGKAVPNDKITSDSAFTRLVAKSFAVVYNCLKERIIARHIDNYVNIIDENSTFIDDTALIESGATIEPFCRIEGASVIKREATISASRVKNSVIGEGASVEMSHVVDSKIGKFSSIGPFARLRQATIDDGCRIGDFVEIKASTIRDGVKASHLTYIGDADVGERTNVGCGSVFCNYDGVKKNKTTIGSDCFIGANTNLIAPLVVGDHAFIAAGTTVTRDVQDDSFTIGRVMQDTKILK